MLEPILKGLVEWFYSMLVSIMAYASGELLGVMSMDLSYFEQTAPAIREITSVFVSLGWALLLGNMVFQLLKSMVSGIGFEAEEPKFIFLRSFVFSFLLLASRQICEIGLSISAAVINLLQVPTVIQVVTPSESMFSLGGDAKWLLVIIVGFILMVQMVKLLFEIGERYVITSILTFFAPLAFAMGGSRNTNDIFKGWCRMYGSMLVMMIMNITFLKLIMSAMLHMANGSVLVWLVFVVALTRVARKIDGHIGKIGLNPAQTGAGIGSRIPGVMVMTAVRAMAGAAGRSIASAQGKNTSGHNRSAGTAGTHGRTQSEASGFHIWRGIHRERADHQHANYTRPGSGNMQSKASEHTSGTTGLTENGIVQGKTDNRESKQTQTTRPPIPRQTARKNVADRRQTSNGAVSGQNFETVKHPQTKRKTQKGLYSEQNSQMGALNKGTTKRGDTSSEPAFYGREQAAEKQNDAMFVQAERHNRQASLHEEAHLRHDYSGGRYNPAAVNKKAKRTHYTKKVPRDNPIQKEGVIYRKRKKQKRY